MKRSRHDFKKLAFLLAKAGAKKAAVFGSYARGEANSRSDLDILVRFSTRKSLLDLVRLERELSEHLGIKIDLLTEKSVSPYLLKTIKQEAMIIV